MTAQSIAQRTVVVAGNPNTGKSTLFAALTGAHTRTGNYPGITVERQRAKLSLPDLTAAELVDSPGTYSLAARTKDEFVALEAVAGLPPIERPDLISDVVDATQLTRNLYLTLQLIELGIPIVVALNMTDEAEKSGIKVDAAALEKALGVPVIATCARKREGIEDLKRRVASVLHDPARGIAAWRWQPTEIALLADLDAVAAHLPVDWHHGSKDRARALAIWSLLSLDEDDEIQDAPAALRAIVRERRAAAGAANRDIDREVITGRYAWIDEHAPSFVIDRRWLKSFTDRVDRVLLSPWIGFPFFALLMTFVFQALFTGSEPFVGFIEELVGRLGAFVHSLLPAGRFADFVQDGVIGGVGAFLVFLPQILMLTLFLQLMEDSGYMARVAVIMDRLMRALGLHGRAFVPMLSGYACAVPAILATRNMERQRDRILTIMVLPFMTCSARLPVYALMIAVIFPQDESSLGAGLLLASMYIFGTVIALAAAGILGRTLFKGREVPLLIEMPPYRAPSARIVLRSLWQQGREFVTKAGSIILICSIGMWLLLHFPRDPSIGERFDAPAATLEERLATTPETETAERDAITTELAELASQRQAAEAHYSLAGRLGRAIEPAIEPLGFDWRIGIGVIGAFAAREVFVSTMGVVYGTGADVDETTPALRERIAASTWDDGRKVFTPLACLSLLIFFALACQCMSTLATVKRETQSWGLTVFMFVYMTAVAWGASFVAFQGGKLLGFE
jgi:ferrous iron transport protein B